MVQNGREKVNANWRENVSLATFIGCKTAKNKMVFSKIPTRIDDQVGLLFLQL